MSGAGVSGAGVSGARSALGFLTVIGGAEAPSPCALPWFPVVGAGLGAALGLVWMGAAHLWPAPVAAAVVIAVDLALTGLLHVDGLADSGDGLLPHLDRQRRLAVMGEPDVGAFGMAVVAAVLLLRVAALGALAASVPLLAGLWCLSRSAMALAIATLRYARPEGLASGFARSGGAVAGGVGLAAAAGLAAWWRIGPGLAAVAGGLLGAGAVLWLADRRLGGYTGDVLGAAGMVAETLGLLVASARW